MSARRFVAVSALAALGLAGCGSRLALRDAVVVTAIPDDVGRCRRLGVVATDSPEIDKDDGLNQLRERAVDLGANAVLVRSYVLSTDGYAYACDPPLPGDGRNAVNPQAPSRP